MYKLISTLIIIFFFILSSNAQNYIYLGDSFLNNVRKFDLEGNFIEMIDGGINTPREIEVDYENRLIFYTNGFNDSSIRMYNMNTNQISFVISDLTEPSRLALDKESQVIYYSEKLLNSISKIDYDGGNSELILNNINGINQLEYDPVNQTLFYVDNSGNMYKMGTDGNNIELISDELDAVHSFKLDFYNEKIYLTEIGNSNSISVMNFDGSEKQVLLVTNDFPSSLDIDFSTNKMYYVIGQSNLKSADLDGSNVSTLNIETNIIGFATLEQDFIIATSINEVEQDHHLRVFPNPIGEDGVVNINNIERKINQIEIIDIKGMPIENYSNIYDDEFKINLDYLTSGIYLIKIKYVDGRIDLKKFWIR